MRSFPMMATNDRCLSFAEGRDRQITGSGFSPLSGRHSFSHTCKRVGSIQRVPLSLRSMRHIFTRRDSHTDRSLMMRPRIAIPPFAGCGDLPVTRSLTCGADGRTVPQNHSKEISMTRSKILLVVSANIVANGVGALLDRLHGSSRTFMQPVSIN